MTEAASKTVEYRLGGVKGPHCLQRITQTLEQLEGVEGVTADTSDNRVQVTYQPATIAGGYLEETLQTLGYSILE